MLLKIKIHGLDELKKTPEQFRQGLYKGIRESMFAVEAAAKKRFNRPGQLHVRTGTLRRSIQSGTKRRNNKIIGYIGSNVIYARIHELGGTIKPIKAKYLKFKIKGHWVSRKQVKIPARPYLTPSITENINTIRNIILNNIIKATHD